MSVFEAKDKEKDSIISIRGISINLLFRRAHHFCMAQHVKKAHLPRSPLHHCISWCARNDGLLHLPNLCYNMIGGLGTRPLDVGSLLGGSEKICR
jgi:hypothetical protein